MIVVMELMSEVDVAISEEIEEPPHFPSAAIDAHNDDKINKY